MAMNTADKIATALTLIGGVNWGLVGAFNFNLVEKIFEMGKISNAIYILVGVAAIYSVFRFIAEELD